MIASLLILYLEKGTERSAQLWLPASLWQGISWHNGIFLRSELQTFGEYQFKGGQNGCGPCLPLICPLASEFVVAATTIKRLDEVWFLQRNFGRKAVQTENMQCGRLTKE